MIERETSYTLDILVHWKKLNKIIAQKDNIKYENDSMGYKGFRKYKIHMHKKEKET